MRFEQRAVEVTKWWDGYLSILYGNYMEIPPAEKRGQHVFLELDAEALKKASGTGDDTLG